jgi:hypothetical protein
MDIRDHYAELVSGFYKEQRQIFDSSVQGVYAYLDDNCTVCNDKFAEFLGMASPAEWSKVSGQGSLLSVFVDNKSQQTLATAFQTAMEKMVGSTIKVTWNKRSGGTIDTTVMLVPVAYQDHIFALHFVSLLSPDHGTSLR